MAVDGLLPPHPRSVACTLFVRKLLTVFLNLEKISLAMGFSPLLFQELDFHRCSSRYYEWVGQKAYTGDTDKELGKTSVWLMKSAVKA